MTLQNRKIDLRSGALAASGAEETDEHLLKGRKNLPRRGGDRPPEENPLLGGKTPPPPRRSSDVIH